MRSQSASEPVVMSKDPHLAFLSNEGSYTVFSCGETRLKFIAPYSLEHYDGVKLWKHGYLVVMAKYRHLPDSIEEYIDLAPILDELLMDRDAFLDPIERVEVASA